MHTAPRDLTRPPRLSRKALRITPLGGVGEIGTPPIAPALANAWHAATGARLAALPLDFSGKA